MKCLSGAHLQKNEKKEDKRKEKRTKSIYGRKERKKS
jgi:hypothetical protein